MARNHLISKQFHLSARNNEQSRAIKSDKKKSLLSSQILQKISVSGATRLRDSIRIRIKSEIYKLFVGH